MTAHVYFLSSKKSSKKITLVTQPITALISLKTWPFIKGRRVTALTFGTKLMKLHLLHQIHLQAVKSHPKKLQTSSPQSSISLTRAQKIRLSFRINSMSTPAGEEPHLLALYKLIMTFSQCADIWGTLRLRELSNAGRQTTVLNGKIWGL